MKENCKMPYSRCFILSAFVIACLGARALVSGAQSSTNTPASSRKDLASFRVITERNIFNTRRSARYVVPKGDRAITRHNPGESFALVGTIHYDKGPFAFFDGNRSDYKKVLKPEDTIAGFKVTEILPSAVKLASPTNEIELPVGMQLRREDETSEWVRSERPESAEPSGGYSGSSHLSFQPQTSVATQAPPVNADFPNGVPDGFPVPFNPDAIQAFVNGDQLQPQSTLGTNSAPSPVPDGVTDPVMLRLMQRRAQERGD